MLGNLDKVNLQSGAKKLRDPNSAIAAIQTMHLTCRVISQASNRRLESQALHCVRISLWGKLSPHAKRMEINSRLSWAFFFFFLFFGKAVGIKVGGVLMSAESDEDVCRKVGREGGCHFCQKSWVRSVARNMRCILRFWKEGKRKLFHF